MSNLFALLKLFAGLDPKLIAAVLSLVEKIKATDVLADKIEYAVQILRLTAASTENEYDDELVKVLDTVDVPRLVEAIEGIVDRLITPSNVTMAAPNNVLAASYGDAADAVALPLPLLFQIAVAIAQLLKLFR